MLIESAQIHLKVHSTDMRTANGKCDWPGCGKRFPSHTLLFIHYRVHTKERPFACPHPECKHRASIYANIKVDLSIDVFEVALTRSEVSLQTPLRERLEIPMRVWKTNVRLFALSSSLENVFPNKVMLSNQSQHQSISRGRLAGWHSGLARTFLGKILVSRNKKTIHEIGLEEKL